MNERVIPLDTMLAAIDQPRRFWDDEYSQHVASLDEAQKLIEQRHRKPRHKPH